MHGVIAGGGWIEDSLEQEDEASLSDPHIDHDNGPHVQIMVCLYHLSHFCYTLVPEIYVRPEILCVFRYINLSNSVRAIDMQLNL